MPTRFEVERAVLVSDLTMTQKCIMLVLAAWTDNATAAIRPENRKSLSEIAAATSAGHSTVARDLGKLERAGWLARRRPAPDKQRMGGKTGYRLLVPAGEGSPPAGLPLVHERDYPLEPSPLAGLPLTSGNEGGSPPAGQGVVHQRDRKAITKENTQKHMAESFGRFWMVYPRKTAKRKTATAYERAVRRSAEDKILAGAERYRDDPNRVAAYTKTPEAWLNGDCWDDDPLPPRPESPNGTRRGGPSPNESWD